MKKYLMVIFLALPVSCWTNQENPNKSWWNSKTSRTVRGGTTTVLGAALITGGVKLCNISSDIVSSNLGTTESIAQEVTRNAGKLFVAAPFTLAGISTGILGCVTTGYGLKQLWKAWGKEIKNSLRRTR